MFDTTNTNSSTDLCRFNCPFCEKFYKRRLYFEKHLANAHPMHLRTSTSDEQKSQLPYSGLHQNQGLVCKVCCKSFCKKYNLRRHERSRYPRPVTSITSLVCDVCHKEFSYFHRLQHHQRKHLEEGANSNGNIEEAKNMQMVTFDLVEKNDEEAGEKEEPKMEELSATLTATASTTTTTTTSFGTSVLNVEFDKMATVIDGRRCFKCDSCSYITLLQSRMKDHYSIHTGERPFTCEQCGRRFRLLNLLTAHIKFVHSRVRNFECNLCGHRFAEKRYLRTHLLLHAGVKLFECDLCGQRFGHRASLVVHRQTHTKTQAFKCHLCPNAYYHRNSLKLHLKWHRGDLNYKCDVCEKVFIDLQHLRRHATVHSDERPHACAVCGALFKLKKYLQNHEKTHRKAVCPTLRRLSVDDNVDSDGECDGEAIPPK